MISRQAETAVIDGLLDTTVLVGLLRREESALGWLRQLPPGASGAISVISVFELLSGCPSLSAQRSLERRLSEFRVIALAEPISDRALRWYRSLHLAHGVGFLDCLVGATASHHGLTVFTHNVKHFRAMPGLRLEVPY